MDFVRLWLHEASRVYGDKLIENKDMDNFQKMKFEIAKQFFEVRERLYFSVNYSSLLSLFFSSLSSLKELDDTALRAEPHIYCHFASGIGEPKYLPVSTWDSLNKILEEALDSYNEINAVMNLVLFEDAMYHV